MAREALGRRRPRIDQPARAHSPPPGPHESATRRTRDWRIVEHPLECLELDALELIRASVEPAKANGSPRRARARQGRKDLHLSALNACRPLLVSEELQEIGDIDPECGLLPDHGCPTVRLAGSTSAGAA